MNKENFIEIKPSTSITGTVAAPPSKSYTNRALLIAALTEGESRIVNPLFSDDTRYMCEALNRFGIVVKQEKRAFLLPGDGKKLSAPADEIILGNAGTAMRFLTTFSALVPGTTRLTGGPRMQERPIEDLLVCLRSMGVEAKSVKNNGCPPLVIRGGAVPGGSVNLAGDKSSQYLTSLLMCAPYFRKDTTINIVGDLTSKSYVDITLDIMKSFGVTVENEAYKRFFIEAPQSYQARTYSVEGDASSASYFFAAAAVSGGEITVTNLNPNSVQGDIQFVEVLEQMGCQVKKSAEQIHLKGNPLRGISINMNNMPDVVQTLAVVSLFAEGTTTITGIANLKIKETDRIDALAAELKRLGAMVETGPDFITIQPGAYKPALVETYDDHRMAMSFAVAGLNIPGIKIKDPECVNKSFPDFFKRWEELYA